MAHNTYHHYLTSQVHPCVQKFGSQHGGFGIKLKHLHFPSSAMSLQEQCLAPWKDFPYQMMTCSADSWQDALVKDAMNQVNTSFCLSSDWKQKWDQSRHLRNPPHLLQFPVWLAAATGCLFQLEGAWQTQHHLIQTNLTPSSSSIRRDRQQLFPLHHLKI